MRKKLVCCMLLILMAAFAACGRNNGDVEYGYETPYESVYEGETEPRVALADANAIATVNGTPIGARDIVTNFRQAEFMVQFMGEVEDHDRAVREEAVRLTAINVVFADYAARYGITVSDETMEEIRREVDGYEEMHGAAEMAELLEIDGIEGRGHLEEIYYNFALIDAVINAIVADPTMFANFEQYMDEVQFETAEDAYHFTRELWQRAIDGEDFDALIATYGEDPGMVANPDGYTFVMGGFGNPVFENATYELEIGEISEPFGAPHGIHIVKRVEPNPDGEIFRPWLVDDEEDDDTEEELIGVKHILITLPSLTREQRMQQAVFNGFGAKASNAEIVFLPALDNVRIP